MSVLAFAPCAQPGVHWPRLMQGARPSYAVVAIVVSEERGQIALAVNGRIERALSPDELRERLGTFVLQRRGAGLQGVDRITGEQQSVVGTDQAQATGQAIVAERGMRQHMQSRHQRVITWS